jgi:hypothetical protein
LALAPLLAQERAHHHGVSELGTVRFPVSCAPSQQPEFRRAVALLHSFGYEEANQAFARVAAADPACGMAWWGVAMTYFHPIWVPPNQDEIRKGAEASAKARAISAKTPRERDYIEAIATFYRDSGALPHKQRAEAYQRAMARLQQAYPQDREAAIFHALAILALLDPADQQYAAQKKAAGILNGVLAEEPNHPGVAHYLIHSYDSPPLAELALKAARSYAKIAPDAPHALHMPSHIFTRLGLWDESIQSNIASAASAKARAAKMHPGAGAFDQLHAMDYLVYAYLQGARDESARRVLTEMAAISKLDEEQFAAAFSFAAAPARFALERHDWKAAAAIDVQPAWFPWDRFLHAKAIPYFAKALGCARGGDRTGARTALAAISSLRNALPNAPGYNWGQDLDTYRQIVEAWMALAEGNQLLALQSMRAAAGLEDSKDKHPVTPGAVLPARELLADMLLETGASKEALAEYQAVLKVAPRRFNSTYGAARAAEICGDAGVARGYYQDLAALAAEAETVRPELKAARSYLARR